MKRYSIFTLGLAVFAGGLAPHAGATTLDFEQLNWFGLASSTPDSTWGRVTVDYTGHSSRRFFNLNVGGDWVVRNMGLDSPHGSGVDQAVSTTFDLGVSDGTDVASVDYVFDITPAPLASAPAGPLLSAAVDDLDYQIGGEGGVDTGSPGAPAAPLGGNTAPVVASAKLPDLDLFVNQVQKTNECAPGAVSNSLKYLQARGTLDPSIDTDIPAIRSILGTTAGGTTQLWPQIKAEHFQDVIMQRILDPTDIAGLIDAVNAGKDVELDLNGHVAVIAGVRQFADGRVELDIFDDDQTDDRADPIRTAEIRGGRVDDFDIDGYVVEMAVVPEPPVHLLMTLGTAGLLLARRNRRRRVRP